MEVNLECILCVTSRAATNAVIAVYRGTRSSNNTIMSIMLVEISARLGSDHKDDWQNLGDFTNYRGD
jgi:hypothetical protein